MIIYALSHFCGLLWRRSSEGGNDFGKDQSNPFQARCILNKKSIVSIVQNTSITTQQAIPSIGSSRKIYRGFDYEHTKECREMRQKFVDTMDHEMVWHAWDSKKSKLCAKLMKY